MATAVIEPEAKTYYAYLASDTSGSITTGTSSSGGTTIWTGGQDNTSITYPYQQVYYPWTTTDVQIVPGELNDKRVDELKKEVKELKEEINGLKKEIKGTKDLTPKEDLGNLEI